jgi:hypothetical protein
MPFRWESTRFLGYVYLSVFPNIILLTSDFRHASVHCHSESSQSEKSLVVGFDASVSACDASLKSVAIKI